MSRSAPSPALFLLVGLLGLGFALAGCSGGRGPRDAGAPASAPRPTLRLVLLTDLKGYLEPCGCTSRPLGGIHRLGGVLDRVAADRVPTLTLAVGDLLLEGDASAARATQDTLQADALVAILGELGVDALAPGALDRRRGDAWLVERLAQSRAARLAAGPELPEGLGAVATELVDVGGTKVGLVAATDAFGLGPADLAAAARTGAAALRAEGASLVVVLLRADRRAVRTVASAPGVDFVVHGGLDVEVPEPPLARGDAIVFEAGRQGQRVVTVDLYVRGPGAFRDESPWSRRVARQRLLQQRDERAAQIDAWAREGRATPAELDAQRARLIELDAELRATDRPRDVSTGNVFVAELVELAEGAPERAAIKARMDALGSRINDHNQRAFADLRPEPAPDGAPSYVGSETCRSCHGGAYQWWSHHLHGRAYQTLVDRDREFNLQCVSCHVTGYGRPGGSTVTALGDGGVLRNVGCESCHGPGSVHVANPGGPGLQTVRAVPESTCVGCHNHEHSDHFDYDTYRARILVPGHGLPVGGAR